MAGCAGNACVFVDARSLWLQGTELPDALEGNGAALGHLAVAQ
jgi:2-methylaconitate cis-trans-isomerase PrpF